VNMPERPPLTTQALWSSARSRLTPKGEEMQVEIDYEDWHAVHDLMATELHVTGVCKSKVAASRRRSSHTRESRSSTPSC
jgi:hypothetical protein